MGQHYFVTHSVKEDAELTKKERICSLYNQLTEYLSQRLIPVSRFSILSGDREW